MEYIYVLKCQKDKYYIGKTYNVQIEYNEHLDGTFCDITKEYKPCDIDSIFEDIKLGIIIGKYILKYGKENIYFESTNIKEIKKIIKEDDKLCICKNDHWLTECSLNLKEQFWQRIFNKVFVNMNNNFKQSNLCGRCGRYGHNLEDCYAKKHLDGYTISDEDCEFL